MPSAILLYVLASLDYTCRACPRLGPRNMSVCDSARSKHDGHDRMAFLGQMLQENLAGLAVGLCVDYIEVLVIAALV